jgi:hypothetical protein
MDIWMFGCHNHKSGLGVDYLESWGGGVGGCPADVAWRPMMHVIAGRELELQRDPMDHAPTPTPSHSHSRSHRLSSSMPSASRCDISVWVDSVAATTQDEYALYRLIITRLR